MRPPDAFSSAALYRLRNSCWVSFCVAVPIFMTNSAAVTDAVPPNASASAANPIASRKAIRTLIMMSLPFGLFVAGELSKGRPVMVSARHGFRAELRF